MNKVELTGRLTRDPDCRISQDGTGSYARFTVAVDRRYKKDGEDNNADFPSCVAFGHNAEFIDKYIRKGTKVEIVGHIQTGNYTNKDGQKVYTTDVAVDEIGFGESKKAEAQPAEENGFVNIDADIDEALPWEM